MNFKDLMVKICILSLFLLSVSFAEGQKIKPVKKQTEPATIKDGNDMQSIPEIKDFAFVVELDKNANVTVKIQKTEDSEFLTDSLSNKNLTDFFTAFTTMQGNKASSKIKNSLDPIVIIKADNSLNFGKIIEVIKSLRVSPNQRIKLQISGNFYVAIPKLPDKNDYLLKPSPFTLLVTLQDNLQILLNRDDYGSFQNTVSLKKVLIEIFNDREKRGVYSDETNEVERKVFVTAPLFIKFGDVIKLIQSIAETGASPIVLQIEEIWPDPPEVTSK